MQAGSSITGSNVSSPNWVIGSGSNASGVSINSKSACASFSTGGLKCWGYNGGTLGALGNPGSTGTDYYSPNVTYNGSGFSGGNSGSVTGIGQIIPPGAENFSYSGLASPYTHCTSSCTSLNLTPSATNGSGSSLALWTITPPLPTGMNFDSTNGHISGYPSVISPMTIYTVNGSNYSGSVSTLFSLQVN
jgi:hypothetical protein